MDACFPLLFHQVLVVGAWYLPFSPSRGPQGQTSYEALFKKMWKKEMALLQHRETGGVSMPRSQEPKKPRTDRGKGIKIEEQEEASESMEQVRRWGVQGGHQLEAGMSRSLEEARGRFGAKGRKEIMRSWGMEPFALQQELGLVLWQESMKLGMCQKVRATLISEEGRGRPD